RPRPHAGTCLFAHTRRDGAHPGSGAGGNTPACPSLQPRRQYAELLGPAESRRLHASARLVGLRCVGWGWHRLASDTLRPLAQHLRVCPRDTRVAGVLGPQHRIAVAEALRAYTVGSAQILGWDSTLGMLAPGKMVSDHRGSNSQALDFEGVEIYPIFTVKIESPEKSNT